jgi:hypothetical protein
MTTDDFLSAASDFNLLSLRDLLAARDQFHLHLINKPHVVATAVGRYRIRIDEPWSTRQNPMGEPAKSQNAHPKRTLSNSEIRPYSWPAILVFVDNWIQVHDLAHPEDAVPPAVYMPDGRKVPICVIEAERNEIRSEGDTQFNFPASTIGGGYPVVCEVQGQEHLASVACLVTDGHKTYALTNRHVAGEAGSPISAIIGRNKVRIGESSKLQLGRLPFRKLYPSWPGDNVFVDLDVGLIDVDDLNKWTTQVYGVGEIGALADLSDSNISLRLIGVPVRAYGAASGDMRGEICALFYRFNSVAGFEYVADVLVGPRPSHVGNPQGLATRPGDSGTLWLTDVPGDKQGPRPIALQWGGQVFVDDQGANAPYALATFLSTVCNQLEISLLRGWNIGLPEYWGAVGHYGIATKACDVVRNPNLKKLVGANLERISYDVADINKKTMAGLSKQDFVPLADVPDMVWKVGPHKRGGMSSPEHANHFADMDRVLKPPLPEGATLLQICDGKPDNVAVDLWRRYYDAVQKQHPGEKESRGLLPFRVWQIYDAMVSFVRDGDVASFVCAAGVVSHYVGDSCQPLHISYMFNGDPDHTVPGTVRDASGKTSQGEVPLGTGVHSAYEDDMVDRHVAEIMTGVDSILAHPSQPALVKGGHAAALTVVSLMQQTFSAIAPKDIIAEFVKVQDQKPAARADALWDALGEDTIKVMADGAICLAQLWDSAWKEGAGDNTIHDLGVIDESALETLYQNPQFLPSKTLDQIGPILKGGPPPAPTATKPKRKAQPRRSTKR